jgi:oligosaccharide 4-alpha-D-glucosyltransferase
MLPYNYTIAFENSRSGMPLMRPMLFEEPDDPDAAISSTYLWGPDFLVAPVTEPGATRKEVYFPQRAAPGSTSIPTRRTAAASRKWSPRARHIPTYVRAGAFVPLAKVVQSTRDYTRAARAALLA